MRGLDAHIVVERGGFRVEATLQIPPGTTAALLGPNGAGKSTIVAALAGLVPLSGGHLSLAGVDLDRPDDGLFVPPADRAVGVVFQDHLLFPHLDLVENVAFGLRSRGTDRRAARRVALNWLQTMGLDASADRRPLELSGGQAQRVALARALATKPDLLLLDEPLSSLDVTTRAGLRRTLAEHLAGFPGPRIVITHDPTEAFLLADEVLVVENGHITQIGTPDDIRLRPRTRYIADLADANLVAGEAEDGYVVAGGHRLQIADHTISGSVLATIRPSAITVHRRRPEGSSRNTWETEIGFVEPLGERVRLMTGAPLPLTAEITDEAARELQLRAGDRIWVSIKATEITVQTE